MEIETDTCIFSGNRTHQSLVRQNQLGSAGIVLTLPVAHLGLIGFTISAQLCEMTSCVFELFEKGVIVVVGWHGVEGGAGGLVEFHGGGHGVLQQVGRAVVRCGHEGAMLKLPALAAGARETFASMDALIRWLEALLCAKSRETCGKA